MHEVGKINKTHGMSDTRLYRIYKHILNRCNNKNDNRYDRYGARGITICEEWKDFNHFAEWALANGYNDKLSIDRINVNMGYSPDNCRWADAHQQSNNKSNNKLYTYNSATHTIAEWATLYNIPYKRLWKRLKCGWDMERALLT